MLKVKVSSLNLIRIILFLVFLITVVVYFNKYESQSEYIEKHTRKFNVKTSWFDRIEVFANRSTYYTTVVSIFIRLPSSKHSNNDYDEWTKKFFKSVTSPIVMLCDNNSVTFLKNLRGDLPILFYVVDDIWVTLSYLENERKLQYVTNYKTYQNKLDPESWYHRPELYAIWNLKPFLMKQVSIRNVFGSSFFIYSDAGAWRDRVVNDWPDEKIVKAVQRNLENKVLLGQVKEDIGNIDDVMNNVIEGGFFGGTNHALEKYFKIFYEIHDRRFKERLFVGKDQTLMKILAFREYNNSVYRLRTWNLNCTHGYDPWFFYQIYFANDQQYPCSGDRLSLLLL